MNEFSQKRMDLFNGGRQGGRVGVAATTAASGGGGLAARRRGELAAQNVLLLEAKGVIRMIGSDRI